MDRKLYIMRSPTGGGKSTKAATLVPEGHIFSTDEYWYKRGNGKYAFEATLIGKAHQWNIDRVEKAMQDEMTPICVDNTNISQRERKPYTRLAGMFGYKVEIVHPDSPWFLDIHPRLKDGSFTDKDVKVFMEKSKHNVPFDAVKRMLSKWEE